MTTQNQGDKNFEGLLGVYLKQSQAGTNSNPDLPHLDEDILSAFVEGAVTERQAVPILRHLIKCAFCRRLTAQLTELSENFDDTPLRAKPIEIDDWRKLWHNLTESVFRHYDNSVVAHEADKSSDEKRECQSDKDK